MSDVQKLFTAYKEAYPADPTEYLTQVSGRDRAELAGLIDAFLERAPRRQFDAAAFRDSPASRVAESVQRSLAGQSGMWPSLLPQLRNRARIKRADLVAQLAALLGADEQRDKVGVYYHQMEQGLLPASGVSDTVLEALGRIIGSGKESLRKAGEMPAPGGPAAGAGRCRVRPQVGVPPSRTSTCPRLPPQWTTGTRSTACSAAVDRASALGPGPDLNPMNELLLLYRYALRVGDRPLTERLGRVIRGDRLLRERADRELQAMPRGPARWSLGAERTLHRLVDRLGAVML